MKFLPYLNSVIAQDCKKHATHTKEKLIRAHNKSKDKINILTKKQINKQKFTKLKQQHAELISKNIIQTKTAPTENFSNLTTKESISKLLANKPKDESNANIKHYDYKHNKYGMIALRKIAKSCIAEEHQINKFKSQDIIDLISHIDISRLTPQQAKSIDEIKTLAKEKNLFNIFMPYDTVDKLVDDLLTLPIVADLNIQNKHKFNLERQKNSKQARLKNTNSIIKASEIFSYGNKESRHAQQLNQVEQIILNILGNADENFDDFLSLCSTSAFRQAIIHQPELGMAVYSTFHNHLKNPKMQQIVMQFERMYSEQISNDKIDEDESTKQKIQTYMNFFQAKNETDMQNWLIDGNQQFEKELGKRAGKRAALQAAAPAVLLGLMATSVAKLVIIQMLKTVPPIVAGFKLAISSAAQINSNEFAQKISNYEQEKGSKANKLEKFAIIACSLVVPVSQGLLLSGAILGTKIAVFSAATAAAGGSIVAGHQIAAGVFGVASLSSLSIGPIAYMAAKKEYKQAILEDIAS